jgi:hypothetical protein
MGASFGRGWHSARRERRFLIGKIDAGIVPGDPSVAV